MQDDSFYRAFEDRHRGSRELIKEKLGVYLPFLKPLQDIYDTCSALDLGCGRGEWLELLGEAGFKVHGVDLDEGMLAACRERGFSVEMQDAIEALRNLADESQAVITGFHIAEHIPFDALNELVKEGLRALKPAGLLILETPNPENIIVGTSNFYLDPTHQRPLPPLLLSFLPEYAGFSRTKILRLQESPGLSSASDIHLLQVLGGVSPDYSVVAQKNGPQEHLELFDSSFNVQYGLTLEMLSTRYEAGLQVQLDELKNELVGLQAEIQENLGIQGQQKPKNDSITSSYLAHSQSLMNDLYAQQREILSWLRDALAQQQGRADRLAGELAQAHAERQNLAERIQRIEHEGNAARASAEEHRQATQHWQAVADQAQQAIHHAKAETHRWWAEADQLHHHQHHLQEQLANCDRELQAVYSSKSWRITRPLRLGVLGLSKLLGRPLSPALALPQTQAQQSQPQAEPLPTSAQSVQNPQSPPGAPFETMAPAPAPDTEASRRLLKQLRKARSASTKDLV